jgi:hypothetical protein
MDTLVTIQELAEKIVEAVRAEASKIPDFEFGAIRITFAPKCQEASLFLGGFSSDCEVDLSYPIKEGGKRTRPADENNEELACNGYTALMVEGCAYALRGGFGRRSQDMPDWGIILGRSNAKGSVVYEILVNNEDCSNRKLYLRIYISVKGALSDFDNERCALAAEDTLVWWHNSGPNIEKFLLYKP